MTGKRFSENEILKILEQAKASGNARAVCRECGISEQTLYRWRKRFPEYVSQAQQLRELRQENTELKNLVAEMTLASRQGRKSNG
jgi:putative transposase